MGQTYNQMGTRMSFTLNYASNQQQEVVTHGLVVCLKLKAIGYLKKTGKNVNMSCPNYINTENVCGVLTVCLEEDLWDSLAQKQEVQVWCV